MRLLPLLLLCAAASAHATDHDELDATLLAPYRGALQTGARTFRIVLDHPQLKAPLAVNWHLELAASNGTPLQTWRGQQQLEGPPVTIDVAWDGMLPGGPAPAGNYRVTLVAEDVEQGWDIAVGPTTTVPFPPVLEAAPSPWRIVLGNLHSQTGHSDGGGDLATCHGAQEPQSSPLGPTAAFTYADAHGLDFLVASEHNHMFDGSTGTNASADPAAARGLFRTGLTAATQYNRDHRAFIALYAQEWGVIANGGHLNVFNAPSLLGWEKNGAGALLADVETPKGDYAGLYTLMRKQGWIGQFNHPSPSGQFMVNGVPLAYTADGDAAKVLCEVVNTNAFSTSADESETRRSNYEAACNRALEAGFHVAFSTDQDNHCANWGMSYTNRTGVLLAPGATLGQSALMEALRARRVFATMDKAAQLILTANGRMMGSRFANQGSLALQAQFKNSAGRLAAEVVIFEGVPGRNGNVTALVRAPAVSIVPTPGEHFYYARVTQEDGNMLWSAPIWVSQAAPHKGRK
jgi:hypothetical protein